MPESVMDSCFACGAEAHEICRHCGKTHCLEHSSPLDPQLCSECINYANTSVTSEPLTDSEGVTHKGRHIILSGEAWVRSRELIEKLTDAELEAKISAMQQAVREAEVLLDYRRINLSQLDGEKVTRGSRKAARLRLISKLGESHKVIKPIAAKKGGKEALGDAFKSLEKLGLPKDAILALLKAIGTAPAAETK